jgi:hypothetical protein
MKRIANHLMCLLVSSGALISVGACRPTAGSLLVEGLEAEYTGNEYVEVTLVNSGSGTVFVAVAVERLDEGAWREVTYSIGKNDPMKATVLTELSSRERAMRRWDSVALPIEAGTYRLRLDIHDPRKREPVAVDHSRAFAVRGPPAP